MTLALARASPSIVSFLKSGGRAPLCTPPHRTTTHRRRHGPRLGPRSRAAPSHAATPATAPWAARRGRNPLPPSL